MTDKLKQVSKDRHSCLLVDHDEAVAVLTVFRDLGLCLVTTACDIIDMVKAINGSSQIQVRQFFSAVKRPHTSNKALKDGVEKVMEEEGVLKECSKRRDKQAHDLAVTLVCGNNIDTDDLSGEQELAIAHIKRLGTICRNETMGEELSFGQAMREVANQHKVANIDASELQQFDSGKFPIGLMYWRVLHDANWDILTKQLLHSVIHVMMKHAPTNPMQEKFSAENLRRQHKNKQQRNVPAWDCALRGTSELFFPFTHIQRAGLQGSTKKSKSNTGVDKTVYQHAPMGSMKLTLTEATLEEAMEIGQAFFQFYMEHNNDHPAKLWHQGPTLQTHTHLWTELVWKNIQNTDKLFNSKQECKAKDQDANKSDESGPENQSFVYDYLLPALMTLLWHNPGLQGQSTLQGGCPWNVKFACCRGTPSFINKENVYLETMFKYLLKKGAGASDVVKISPQCRVGHSVLGSFVPIEHGDSGDSAQALTATGLQATTSAISSRLSYLQLQHSCELRIRGKLLGSEPCDQDWQRDRLDQEIIWLNVYSTSTRDCAEFYEQIHQQQQWSLCCTDTLPGRRSSTAQANSVKNC